MQIPEPITVARGMRCSDWPGLSHMVTCPPLQLGVESASLESNGLRMGERVGSNRVQLGMLKLL